MKRQGDGGSAGNASLVNRSEKLASNTLNSHHRCFLFRGDSTTCAILTISICFSVLTGEADGLSVMGKKGEKIKYTKDGKPINIRRYSNAYKLEVAKKVTHQDGNNISSVARDHGLPESTLRQWVKDVDKLQEHIASHSSLKTIHADS
jgi:AraC-like DNA-binding protein